MPKGFQSQSFVEELHYLMTFLSNSGLFALSVVWLDLRTQSTVERLINKTPGQNKNHLKVRETHKKSFVL